MWRGLRVVVIVPAYNEAPRIGRVLRGIPSWVDAIVVVDDASRDATTLAARAVEDPRVEIVWHRQNRGVGAALATGYQRAVALTRTPYDAIVVMAGDGQMDPEDLPALLTPLATGDADYVKGNRFNAGIARTARSMPLGRLVGGLLFSWATSRAIGVPISDSQCGYTAISREACGRLDLRHLWPRYGYPNDVLSQLAQRRLRIVEVPVRAVYADEVSGLKLRHLPVIAGLVVRAWIRRHRPPLRDLPFGTPRCRSRPSSSAPEAEA